jgi:hypothetical protein
MDRQIWIGIDNGASGTIGWITNTGDAGIDKIPTKVTLNYQKRGKFIARVDLPRLLGMIQHILAIGEDEQMPRVLVGVERPFTGPRFNTVASGMRAFEAVLIGLEQMALSYVFLDSKQWQGKILGKSIKGTARLKSASKLKAEQLYPKVGLKSVPDADGLLIAYYLTELAPFGVVMPEAHMGGPKGPIKL